MAITALPTPPSRSDPTNFASRADGFLGALPTFATEANALATDVNNKQVAAANSATASANSAVESSNFADDSAASAVNSEASAVNSEASAVASAASAAAAAASFDSFDDRYLSAKTSDPSLDNDGNALITGALYFNSSVGEMRVRTSGGTWAAAYIPVEGYLTDADIGSTVQAYDADLTAWAGKTAPSGTAVGTSDSQTLTNKTIEAGTLTNGYTEEVYALGTSGSLALNPANGSIQTCALTGNPTFTDSLAAGQSVVVMLTNGSSYTVTFPTMTWVGPTGNVAPTLNSANVLVFWKVSSTLYGAHVGKYA